MDAFETSLKRAFAEASEPEDAGFTVRVADAVTRRERVLVMGQATQRVGFAAAGAAIFFGVFQVAQTLGPQLMASIGLELARANGALSQSTFSIGAGLTPMLLVIAALAGGAVAYRSVRE